MTENDNNNDCDDTLLSLTCQIYAQHSLCDRDWTAGACLHTKCTIKDVCKLSCNNCGKYAETYNTKYDNQIVIKYEAGFACLSSIKVDIFT